MKRDRDTPRTALVLGSGIGGLSTAILLAGAGLRVTVVEKNAAPGGLTRGYFRRGIECEVGIHYLGALGEGQVLRRLFELLGVADAIPVERMGRDGIVDRYVFDDFVFDMPEGLDAYEANLRETFPAEGAAIAGFMARLRPAARRLNRMDLLFSRPDEGLASAEFEPLGAFLEALGCSPGLRAVLSVPSCWIGVPPAECPVFYHTMALSSYLLSSWRLTDGGTAMANAFADRFRAPGGEWILGDGVAAIEVKDRSVRSVRLESGRILEADRVVAAFHPAEVLALMAEDAAPPLYRKRIRRLRNTHGILCVQASVDAAAHPEIPHNLLRVHRDEIGNVSDLQFHQLRRTRRPDRNLLSILTAGDEAFWSSWSRTRTGARGPEYREAKERRAETLLRESEALLGPLRGAELLDVYTPLTIRDWVNSPGGSAYGILRSCEQIFSAALLNRTPVRGLFLAGQSVLAPGVLGTIMGSLATVRFVLGNERFRSEILDNIPPPGPAIRSPVHPHGNHGNHGPEPVIEVK
jgi:all-trans-retinol 13,14-reductase